MAVNVYVRMLDNGTGAILQHTAISCLQQVKTHICANKLEIEEKPLKITNELIGS